MHHQRVPEHVRTQAGHLPGLCRDATMTGHHRGEHGDRRPVLTGARGQVQGVVAQRQVTRVDEVDRRLCRALQVPPPRGAGPGQQQHPHRHVRVLQRPHQVSDQRDVQVRVVHDQQRGTLQHRPDHPTGGVHIGEARIPPVPRRSQAHLRRQPRLAATTATSDRADRQARPSAGAPIDQPVHQVRPAAERGPPRAQGAATGSGPGPCLR